ncbi:ADP-ribose pyrophosphatase YjhB, NUDIX family [Sphingobacterium lactis]|uniref:ADP-ribose pyrophosphatase YjhB, NUDIX family n=2 Tax=Sphingobacterium lactis TaxID=797291 RepID=A0A1H5U2H3_9SPHI|nr:ADP-ribose pyrophosphatase YjhB, NUDIX family [Sphingobacterium lactis]
MNQSLLILADFAPRMKENIQTIGLQDIDLEKLFTDSNQSTDRIVYLYIHPDIRKVFKKILSTTKIIKAAGGLVKNGNGEYLFIHRLGKWDLPKGKVEEGEKMKEAALREVEEECGIKIDYLGKKLAATYHTYYMRNRFVLKQTKWYEMGVNKIPKLTPQLEEDIDKAEWLKASELKKVKDNTYPLILEIVNEIKK